LSEGRTRRLAAVWFADIVGYTALSNTDEDAALQVVDEFQRLVRESVGEKGRVVKFLGDGALSVFDSAQRAIESAVRLRDAFEESRVARAHACSLSVGVHMGEVVAAEDGDVYGEGVNIASRIEGVATAGQVLLSDDVYRLIRNRPGFHVQPMGEHALKGVATPMPLYLLARPGEVVTPPPRKARAGRESRRAMAVGWAAGVAGFVVLSVFVASASDLDEPGGAPTRDSAVAGAAPVRSGAGATPVRNEAAPPAGMTGGGAAGEPARPLQQATTLPDQRPARETTEAGGAADLAVLALSDGPGAQLVEQAVARAFGPRSGVRAASASALGLMRRNPDAVRNALRGDMAPLLTLARTAGLEYLALGRLETSASRTAARGFTGSADLALRLLDVSTGALVDEGAFAVGTERAPGPVAPTEAGARTEAAQAVGRLAATAARTWLERSPAAGR